MRYDTESPPPYNKIDPSPNSFSLLPPGTGDSSGILQSQYDSVISGSPSFFDNQANTTISSVSAKSAHSQPVEDESICTISTAAQAYFLSRKPRHEETVSSEIYYLSLHPQLGPADLPYQSHFSEKDITEQDWATFLNFLFPEHVSLLNNSIIDRKLEVERATQQIHQLPADDLNPSRMVCNIAAELESFRPFESSDIAQSEAAVISEWNNCFFKPRGLQIAISGDKKDDQSILRHRNSCSENEAYTEHDVKELLGYTMINDDTISHFGENDHRPNSSLSIIDEYNIIGSLRKSRSCSECSSNEIEVYHSERPDIMISSRHKSLSETCLSSLSPQESHTRSNSPSSQKNYSSSSASISSIESLPDYDDLSLQQLKSVGRLLLDWVLKPELNPVMQIFQQVKQVLRNLQPEQDTTSKDDSDLQTAELRELFEKLKKCQKAERRKLRREKIKNTAAKRHHKRQQRKKLNKERYYRRKNKINKAAIKFEKS